MTGLFGELDAADIPDNPFYVAPGTYECILTEATVQDKKDQSGQGLSFKWVIQDEESEYNKQNISDWFNIYPGITRDEVTPKIKQDMSRLRQRLNQMNIPEEEQGSLLENLDDLIGMVGYVTVKETPDKEDPDKKYTNITKVEVEV